jgi:hypothetical protein
MLSKKALKGILEKRRRATISRNPLLVERWKDIVNEVASYMKEKRSEELSMYDKHNMAICLENAAYEATARSHAKLFEATEEEDITFLGVQLPVIAALLPSLVLNKIAIVQALDRRQGAVFYLDVKYGTSKGAITSGADMIDPRTGIDRTESGRRYAIDKVFGEVLSGTGTSRTGTFGGSVTWGLGIVLGTVRIYYSGTEVANDHATDGTLAAVGGSGVTGTVTSAGVYSISGLTSSSGNEVTADYQYVYDKVEDAYGHKTGVGQVDIALTSETVAAQDFTLQAKYSLGASIDLEKAHGLNLESEIIKYLGGEIKFEIDHWGIDMIVRAATGGREWGTATTYSPATAITTWNAAVGSGQEWIWKKYEILDRVIEGSNNIFSKTLRGFGNFIICGNNVARVLRQLTDHFKPDASLGKTVPTGPIVLGTVDNMLVIQDPLVTTNRYIVGYKGDNYLYAGMIYAPYIPLFATPTLLTSDLFAQKGFMSAAGFKIINAGLFTYGDITGLGT